MNKENIEQLNKKLNEINSNIERLKSDKYLANIFTIGSICLIFISIYAYIFTNVGINEYYLLFGGFGLFSTSFSLNNLSKTKKELKIAERQQIFIENFIEDEKTKLKNLKSNSNKQINNNNNIKKNISSSDLKKKLLIIKDYLLHQQEYQIYYDNGFIDWYLSEKYNENDLQFLKELISQDLIINEDKSKKNKTKIK